MRFAEVVASLMEPAHDWASHGADAFRLMCVAYEEPRPM